MKPVQKLTNLLNTEEQDTKFLNEEQLYDYMQLSRNYYSHIYKGLDRLSKGCKGLFMLYVQNKMGVEADLELRRSKSLRQMADIYDIMAECPYRYKK